VTAKPITPTEAISMRDSLSYIEAMYESFQSDPSSVGESWQLFFAGFELSSGAFINTVSPEDAAHQLRQVPALV